MKIIRANTINSDGTIYLPNAIRKALKLNNGGKLSLEVVDGALIIKPYFNIAGWAEVYLTSYDVNVSIFYKVGRDRLAGITTVILSNGKIGVAQCSPNDAFDDVVGEAIALARALGKDDEIPKEVFG
nr:MAG TPA: AbrB family transcriptional regulator-like protein [Caudoviricetes sp.]